MEPPQVDEQAQNAAAIKIQAITRGNEARAEVEKLKANTRLQMLNCEAKCRQALPDWAADPEAAFLDRMADAELELPLHMLHVVATRLHDHYLAYQMVHDASPVTRRGTRAEKRTRRAAFKREKAKYLWIIRVHNAWVRRANEVLHAPLTRVCPLPCAPRSCAGARQARGNTVA